MPVLLSHNSALERLRSIPPSFDHAAVVEEPFDLSIIRPTRSELRRSYLESLGVRQFPVHVLYHEDIPRSKSEIVRSHMQAASVIPRNLVKRIGNTAFTSGPELVFLQMARQTSLIGLIVLGYELCGSYSHFAPLVSGFYERTALTSAKSIVSALGLLKKQHGNPLAQQAIRFVLDGSASPMETVLSCMLTLPNDQGGEGLAFPSLNHTVELDALGRRLTGHKTARIDIAWADEMIGLEYDGGPYHTDPEADRLRREALSRAGWRIYTADIDRMVAHGKYVDLLGLIEGQVPRRNSMSKADAASSRHLFKRLMKATRAGIGLNPMLFNTAIPEKAVKIHVC